MPITVNGLTAGEEAADKTDRLLHLSFLGEFSVRQGETAVSLDTSSYQSLLAYLVLHPQAAHSRRQLAFQFWPDSNEAQARTNLRKAIYTLRQSLPDADRFLQVTRQTVRWRADAPCVADVSVFETAVAQSQQTNPLDEQQSCLEMAVAAYQGDFMPGHYDDWTVAYREKLRSQYLAVLGQLILGHERQREYLAAIEYARQLLREDPLHETAYRRLMRLQSLDGNVAGALRTYHTCCTRLQRELGVDPSPTTRETYERLLRVPAAPAPLAPSRLPLAGREQAWRTLQTAWERCSNGRPGAALLTGEAGIGKTRLAEEMVDWAERQGIVAMTAVCYPSEGQLSYAPVAKWLRSDNMQPIFRRIDGPCLVECSRLLPELNSQHPDLPAPSPLTESWQRQHFFSVLAQTMLQLRQPFLLFVDDLPWCDQDSLDWLLFLLRYEAQAGFLLLGSARSAEITADHPLIQWQQQLDREGRLINIELERLDSESSAQLAGDVLKRPLDSRQANRLFAETEGNPLFVVEMARAGSVGQPHPAQLPTLPAKVQSVIETRLAALSMPAYELAQLAAVIGRSFTFKLLIHACFHEEDTVIRSLDELWQRRIVREQGLEAYDFSHDKIRQVAYESLSWARRRQLHERVWRTLETVHADNLDTVSGQIAAHCEAAGHDQEAIAYYQRAARVAQAVYANQDTMQYLRRAIGLFPLAAVNMTQQVEIYEQMGDVQALMGEIEEARITYRYVVSNISSPIGKSRLFRKMTKLHLLQKHYDKALQTLNEAEVSLGDPALINEPSHWQEWLQLQLDRLWLHYWVNDHEAMTQLARKLKPIIKLHGTKMQKGLFFQRLVMLSFRLDRYVVPDETVQYAKESLAAIEESGELSQIAFARFILGFASLWHGYSGELDAAENHLQAALKQAEQIGDVFLQCRCLSYLPLVNRKKGQIEETRVLIPSALAVAEQCQMPDYIANARGNLAWVAWRDGDLAEAQKHGQAALAAMQQLQLPMPMKWIALWPMVGISMANDEVASAVGYAQTMIEPNQLRFHGELTAVLQRAITAWGNNQPDAARTNLEQAIQLAQKYRYL